MAVVLGIVMFMGLVLIHELGHFITAKKSGVKVLEFGIGIPPKVCKLRTDKSGTQYTLNLIPLGGFVRLKGEDPNIKEDFHAKDSFIKAKMKHKILIMIAGVTANFILAWVLFSAIFAMGTKPISIISENALLSKENSYLMPTQTFLYQEGFITETEKQRKEAMKVQVAIVDSGSLSYQMGIVSGDIIQNINGIPINQRNLNTTLKENIGGDISLSYLRKGKTTTVTGSCAQDNCILGIAFVQSSATETQNTIIKFPIGKAMQIGFQEIKTQTILTFSALGTLGSDLFSFQKERIKHSLNKLTGPAGAIKFGEILLSEGGRKLYLGFAGMISLALAIFNILPIPALDGGRLISALIQGIAKLKPEKYFTIEGYINLIFFIILMGLGIYILLKDLVRFRDIKLPFLG